MLQLIEGDPGFGHGMCGKATQQRRQRIQYQTGTTTGHHQGFILEIQAQAGIHPHQAAQQTIVMRRQCLAIAIHMAHIGHRGHNIHQRHPGIDA